MTSIPHCVNWPAYQFRKGLDGQSFVPNLRDITSPTKDHVIHVYPRGVRDKGQVLGRAIRTKQYRLVEWRKIGDAAVDAEWELYDYESDPLETRNLAAERPEVVAKLKTLLATHPEATPQVKASP